MDNPLCKIQQCKESHKVRAKESSKNVIVKTKPRRCSSCFLVGLILVDDKRWKNQGDWKKKYRRKNENFTRRFFENKATTNRAKIEFRALIVEVSHDKWASFLISEPHKGTVNCITVVFALVTSIDFGILHTIYSEWGFCRIITSLKIYIKS